MFSAQFDTIEQLANNDLFTRYMPVHVGWDTYELPATGPPPEPIDVEGVKLRVIGQVYYVHKESKHSQWEFPPADSKVEMTFSKTIALANRTADFGGADFGGGGGNLNYRKNKISINLHNRSRSNRYRSHRYRKNKHIINLYKRARKGTRRLS